MQQQQQVSMMCSPLVDMFWVYIIKKSIKYANHNKNKLQVF